MAKDIFIGNPTIFKNWYDQVRPLTLDEYMEQIQSGPMLERSIKIDTALYQGDDGKLVKPIEWEILGYNGVIPQYVRYGDYYFVKLFETNIENGEDYDFDNPIKVGQKVYQRTWNSETLQWDYNELKDNTIQSTTVFNITHNDNDYTFGKTNSAYGIKANPYCQKTLTLPGMINIVVKYKTSSVDKSDAVAFLDLNLINTVQIQTKNLFMDLDWCQNYNDAKSKLTDTNYFSTILYDCDSFETLQNGGSNNPWLSSTIRSWLNGLSAHVLGGCINIENDLNMNWDDEAQISAYYLSSTYLTKTSFVDKFKDNINFLQKLSPTINQTYEYVDSKVLYSTDKFWLPSIGDYITDIYSVLINIDNEDEEDINQMRNQIFIDANLRINLYNKLTDVDKYLLKLYKNYENGFNTWNIMMLRSENAQDTYLNWSFQFYEEPQTMYFIEWDDKCRIYSGFAPICSLELNV